MSIASNDLDDLRDLSEARCINHGALVEQLRFMSAKTHASGHRKPMSESEKLLDEAFWYAQRGEIDEVLYRLSMIDDDDVFDDEEEDGDDE